MAVVSKLATRICYTGSQLIIIIYSYSMFLILTGETESDNSMSAELFVVMYRRVLGV